MDKYINSTKVLNFIQDYLNHEDKISDTEKATLIAIQQYIERTQVGQAADDIEELLKAAKAMHTWIFLNTGDEQAVYDECGLTDEMNAMLGYGGQFVAELPKEEHETRNSTTLHPIR